jgi:hypothetical protein
MLCTARVRAARQKLHEAIANFETGADPRTPDQKRLAAAREYAAASQASRAALKAAGFNPQSQRTKNFVMKQMVNGPKRGALSEAGRAHYGFNVPGSPAALAGKVVPDKIRGQR